MSYRMPKRFQILFLTALLIVITGVAASPVGTFWSPLLARPFGQWLGRSPVAVVSTLPVQQPSTANGGSLAAGEPLLVAAAPGGYAMPPGELIVRDTSVTGSQAAAARRASLDGSQRADYFGATRRSGYSSGPSGGGHIALGNTSGGSSGTAAQSGGGQAESGSRVENAKARASAPPSRSADGAPGFAPLRGSDGGSTHPGKPKDKDPGGIFGEHKKSLDHLTGSKSAKNSPHDSSGSFGGTNVAVNPEPSTLFLFGTGMVAAAGAIRRRLR